MANLEGALLEMECFLYCLWTKLHSVNTNLLFMAVNAWTVFSQPYLRNGRAYGTAIVCRLFLCRPSGRTVAKRSVIGANFLREY